jgi:hypothetical protein
MPEPPRAMWCPRYLAILYPHTMAALEWILVILLMIPAVLVGWAFFKSGEPQKSLARLRSLPPAARRRVRTARLVTAVVGTAVGAAIMWVFLTGHITLGLAVLIGLIVLNGVVTPLLQRREETIVSRPQPIARRISPDRSGRSSTVQRTPPPHAPRSRQPL